MIPFKHILVPTDFSESAGLALDTAITLAEKFDSKITVLHATWLPPGAYAAYAEGLFWPTEDMVKGAEKALAATMVKVKSRYPQSEGVIVNGESWPTILEVAKERSADLIVMGTHGRRGVARVLLGSVAERIVRLSPIPVLTISGESERDAAKKASERAAHAKHG